MGMHTEQSLTHFKVTASCCSRHMEECGNMWRRQPQTSCHGLDTKCPSKTPMWKLGPLRTSVHATKVARITQWLGKRQQITLACSIQKGTVRTVQGSLIGTRKSWLTPSPLPPAIAGKYLVANGSKGYTASSHRAKQRSFIKTNYHISIQVLPNEKINHHNVIQRQH